MKRKFVVGSKQTISADYSGVVTWEVDPDKAHDVAVDIMNGVFDDQIGDREEDVDWGMYDSSGDLAEDVPAILYLLFGLEDGEDYQILNGSSVMYTDSSNGLWKQAKMLLSDNNHEDMQGYIDSSTDDLDDYTVSGPDELSTAGFYKYFDENADSSVKKKAADILYNWYTLEDEEYMPDLDDILDMCDAATDEEERKIVLTALGSEFDGYTY